MPSKSPSSFSDLSFAKNPRKVLICDDDELFHFRIRTLLSDSNSGLNNQYEVLSCYNGDEALTLVSQQPIDILLLDNHIRFANEGLNTIPKLLKADPDLSIVMNSHTSDFQVVREAMRKGAVDYLVKDLNSNDELTHTLERVMEKRLFLQREEQSRFETLNSHKNYILIGDSKPMRNLRRMIERVRYSSANVLITGETGTGKELIARQLRGTEPNGSLIPFVAIDSSTIQCSTAESMLFGHERGSFTGAEKTTRGIFEEANGGIVYFDEISNMPLNIQVKLLRVLQEKEICRVGSSKAIPLNFRVICATNMDLEKQVKEGLFKFDLLQRLNVIPLEVAPLRERAEDIPLLVRHFTRHFPQSCAQKQTLKRTGLKFTDEALQALQNYSWPGNVRELESLVTYLSMMVDESVVTATDLPSRIREERVSHLPTNRCSFYERVAQFETTLLSEEYSKHEGNISHLATALKMDRSHLYSKLKSYGIHRSRSSL
jgi:DNA-binding NtrC family response regulator